MPAKTTLRQKAVHEGRQLAAVTVYLCVCFGALLAFKATLLHGQGISFTPWGIAAVKAIVLVKFILIGNALHVGERYTSRSLIVSTAYKAVVFLAFLVVLTIIEGAIIAIGHGRPISESLSDITGRHLGQTIAGCFIMLLILIPYLVVGGIDAVLGEGAFFKLLFIKPDAIKMYLATIAKAGI